LNYGGVAVHDGTGGTGRDFSGVARDNIYAAPGSAFTDGLTGWTYTTQPVGYLDSDAHYSGLAGATATYTFTGTTVTWIGGKNTDHGLADVAVCDAAGDNCGPVTTVDTRAPASIPQQALYTASNLSDTVHTLKITVVADTTGTGHYTDVDGFISGTSTRTIEVNDTDPAITYSYPPDPWMLTDNLSAAPSAVYNAAYDFSAAQGTRQWHEQFYTPGLGWQDLATYDSRGQQWGHNAFVSQFTLHPGPGLTGSVARAWIAPSTGTIAIRGRILQEAVGGTDVTARITVNGKQIWPAANGPQQVSGTDTTGYDSDVTLHVNAGDTIRFEVSAAGPGSPPGTPTAWVPSIAYQ
jgi:hypothetical protein